MTLREVLLDIKHPGYIEKKERREKCTVRRSIIRVNAVAAPPVFYRISTQHVTKDHIGLDIALFYYQVDGPDGISCHRYTPVFSFATVIGANAACIGITLTSGESRRIRHVDIIGWSTGEWMNLDLHDTSLQTNPLTYGEPLAIYE